MSPPADAAFPVLPRDVRRDGDRLFDVAMWCLGRDVLCPEGNLLLRGGFTRERPPPGMEGQSAYWRVLPGGGRLVLWGFGALCEVCGAGVFVPRDGFAPRLVEVGPGAVPAFSARHLGPCREPASPGEQRAARAGVVTLAEWLAGHEAWVAGVAGASWRRTCLEVRRKAPPVSADALATAWGRVAARVRALDAATAVHGGTAPMRGA